MNKFLTITAAFLLACVTFGQDANRLFYIPITATCTSVVGTAVDVSAYKGNAAFLVSIPAEQFGYAGLTSTVTIAHSANGTTWKTITNINSEVANTTTNNGTTNVFYTFKCDLGRLSKYVRANVTLLDGTNGTTVILAAPMKAQ